MAAEIKIGSDRNFGFVFTVFFLVVGLWPLMDGSAVRTWSLIAAILFLTLALVAPKILCPLNKGWCHLGVFMGRITSPIVIFVLFFLVVTPTGLLMRAFGKDLLRQKPMPDADSYWLAREEPVGTMKRQF